MKIRAVHISQIDFSRFGIYYDMKKDKNKVKHSKGDGWEDFFTKVPVMDTPAHFGLTLGLAAPFEVKKMERHFHTQEVLFCGAEPIILAVANSGISDSPKAEDIIAVIINPGELVMIERGIWHAACHGIDKETYYYYIATAGQESPQWIDVKGEPVTVEV